MSHLNDLEFVLPKQYQEDLKNLTDELLQHEIDFCKQSLDKYPEKYTLAMKKRLIAAENEVERRLLS